MSKEQRKQMLNNSVQNKNNQRFMGQQGGNFNSNFNNQQRMPHQMGGMMPMNHQMGQMNQMGGPMKQGMMPQGMPMQGMPMNMMNKGMPGMQGGPQGMMRMPGQMPGGMPGQMPGGMPGQMPGGMQPNMMQGMKMMQGVRNPQTLNQPPMMGQPQQPQQQPKQQDDWKIKRDSFSIDHFNTLKSTQDKCQYLGEIFWPYVASKEPELKRKITGFMIWNFDHKDLIEAIKNEDKLNEIFEKSKKTVQNTVK
jgi:hypothetical protein